MEQYLRLSDFCHIEAVGNGTFVLYNALTAGVLFVEGAIAQLLRNAAGNIFALDDIPLSEHQRNIFSAALLERRLAFPVGQRLDLEDYQKMQKLLQGNGIGILYLLLADGCNLACKYCYIENAIPLTHVFSTMTQDTAEAALQSFARVVAQDIEEPQVILYGGEPLLNKSVLYWVINRVVALKQESVLPEKTGITINTNGTLIDQTFISFVKGKNIQISISLDGKQDAHDMMRCYRDGSGSFENVMNACKQMRNNGVDFGFSVTVTKANIEHMEEIILWLHEEFQINSIGFNIVIDRNEELLGMSEDVFADKLTQQLIQCFKLCREKGIYEDRIMRKVDAFIKGYPYLYDCGAPGDQMVVTPQGMVGVCQAFCGSQKYFIPLADFKEPSNHPIWQQWRYRSPFYQKQCYDCVALGICGGGCPYNAEKQHGSMWALDDMFCTHARGTLRFLLQDLYRQQTQE
ncbi:hypothetical protein A2477_03230 [Candidatus Falkowbacteria bacterium RIFOXYC2_FULL_47_12]|uniref:Radical SAM core domain-containing protein n=2 Tax=Candidatus Falkowiibacteriota TaxID=1752728 RepID=A0A1F5TPU1_9BACT|nr:MAG: hypothetical protein A2242_04865 [Candidatus Falkowbacteria bacterium RIFOXYA2_FULL_47_9]OGF40982.1 MAG: hypothetical protein A2477_03230 [Candidatus Falkowbacteria bacterium RIFOXYC2_FULL_47_12]